MKKLTNIFLTFFLVAIMIGVVIIPPQSASAAGLIAYGYDLTGDGINDTVQDDGYNNIYIQDGYTGYKYQSYNIPYRASLTIQHNVNTYAGNEMVITDNYNQMYVIGVHGYQSFNFNNQASYGTKYLYFYDLDGYAGKEIAVAFGSSPHVAVVNPREGSSRIYYANSNYSYKSAFTFVDSDGTVGLEIFVVTPEGNVTIFDVRDHVTRYYYAGTGWRNIEFVNLDGVVGQEIIFNWYDNQVRIRDRTYSYY